MKIEHKILLMGALLHDIGKFAQRAKRPYSEEMIGEYLPVWNGNPSHWHSVYTDYFIENDLPLPFELENQRSLIARVASAHHKPDSGSLVEMCVCVADRLSSGVDREKNPEAQLDAGFRSARLISVFDEIELAKHRFNPPGEYYYNLSKLDVKKGNMFPQKGKPVGSESDYEILFNKYLEDLSKIDTSLEFNFYFDSLISLLEKYCWAVPSSSYKTYSDISLFDHMHSTAGIAQALYIYHKQNDSMPQPKDQENKFILVGGDISGIQNYIFGISKNSGRGVSKILRARSFFLQAVTQSVILDIQTRLGLFSVCRLIDSGGKYMLIVSDTPKTRDILNEIEADLQLWFRKKFKGSLTAVLSSEVKISHADFKMDIFPAQLDRVNESIEKKKLSKLSRAIEHHGTIIDDNYLEDENGNCSICSINACDSKATEEYNKYERFSDDNFAICRDCSDQIIYIGARLPRTSYLVYGKSGRVGLFGNLFLNLEKKLPEKKDDFIHIDTLVDEINFARSRIAKHLPVLTDSELKDNDFFSLFEKEDGFDVLCKRDESERTKTFSMIAAKSKKKDGTGKLKGRALIAFFKADVDNLGLVFSMGFGRRLSVARLASASRMLNIFFSEYIVHLIREECPDIYVVYSGGDDLFLIGPWRQKTRFSILLRKKFAEFCGHNKDITMSGGFYISKPRTPIRQAAEIAERNLEKAKQYRNKNQRKDAVTFLDEVTTWSELERLIDVGEQFDIAMKEKHRTGFSMAFLYRLLIYHKMYRSFINEGQMNAGRYLSHAHYDISRNIVHQGKKKRNGNKKELDMLYRIFSVGVRQREGLDLLNIPLFYAMNLNRDDK